MARGKPARLDAIAVALHAEIFASIAEEMGVALQRCAFSPNVKERRDYSCALFTGDGMLVAQAAHIPVHLGSTTPSVAAVLEDVALLPGDEIILNDPFRGGTHLPDVTLVRPVFLTRRRQPTFLVVNRAHHADIGGPHPGSMGLSRDIHGEGFRMPPVRLRRGGKMVDDVLRLFRAQVRQPDEREGDLSAQIAANHVGELRLRDLGREQGVAELLRGARALPGAAERAMREELRRLPRGCYRFTDQIDDDGLGGGPARIRVAITLRGERAEVDFAGSSAQVAGPMNANLAITRAAVAYAFRCLLRGDVPTNDGILAPIRIAAPPGSIVHALPPAAVAAGNVETSQRIVDVLFGALAQAAPEVMPAASAGTMTNLSLGGADFTYYETVGGGSGASKDHAGASAVQTHMTNTLNTPIEMLESTCPLRVVRYAIRRGTGGRARQCGGDGIDREIEALAPLRVSVLAERQHSQPFGLDGGGAGAAGVTSVRVGGRERVIAAKAAFELAAGQSVRVRTPGGGGHGRVTVRSARPTARGKGGR